MIKEVIDKILDAEKQADEIIAAANAESRDIELSTESRIEKERERLVSEAFSKADRAIKAARDEGEYKASEIEKADLADREKMIASGENNLKKATEYLINRIIENIG